MSARGFSARGVLGGLALVALMAAPGCRCSNAFVEGTRFRAGIYVPVDGQLYGLQLIEYLNGTAVLAPSNAEMKVSREYAATNSYLGAVHTADSVRTRAETR